MRILARAKCKLEVDVHRTKDFPEPMCAFS
jgi:hypothetical protein